MLPRNIDVHTRSTRHGRVNIVCPRYKRKKEGGRSSAVSCTKSWNKLPSELRKKDSLFHAKAY